MDFVEWVTCIMLQNLSFLCSLGDWQYFQSCFTRKTWNLRVIDALKLKKNRTKGKNAHTEILFEKNRKDTLVWPSIDIEKLIVCIWIYFFASLTTELWWCSGHVVCLWNGRSGFKSWLGNFFFYFSHLHFQLLSTSFFCFLCLKIKFFVFTFKKLKTY